MLKKTFVFILVVLFVGVSIVSGFNTISNNNSQPVNRDNWLYVGGNGTGNYTHIQDAIENATNGDNIFVYNGTYYENIIIDKTINLIGEDRNITIIDGNSIGIVVVINADGIIINGFTIQNGNEYTGGGGVDIHSSNNIIENNLITLNLGDAIRLNYLSSGGNNTITNNMVIDNAGGINVLGNCNFNTISGNIISVSGSYGLVIGYSHDNIIFNNYINLSGMAGFCLENSQSNIVIENNICNNNNYGIKLVVSSNNNILFHNNIKNNTQNAFDNGTNIWYNSTLQGGNFYDDYTGIDNNSDGIGDIPYNITGGSNQDLYPLMHPFENYYVLDIIPENNTINEGAMFNVTVKSLGGTRILDALVEFNDELKLTDSNGVVNFTAPQVVNDTYYEINTTKEGYIGANKTIIVKNMQNWASNVIMFGLIKNLTTVEENIEFNAKFIGVVQFSPFSVKIYNSGQKIIISKFYRGFVGYRFIFTACDLLI